MSIGLPIQVVYRDVEGKASMVQGIARYVAADHLSGDYIVSS